MHRNSGRFGQARIFMDFSARRNCAKQDQGVKSKQGLIG
jgi:hypothetical protein